MARPALQLFLLFLAVPAQYLLSRWMSPVPTDREYLTRRLLQSTVNFLKGLVDWQEWKSLIHNAVERSFSQAFDGECVAKEVFMYKEPKGYFAGSPEPRLDRSKVKYRVGQVIKHKKFGYRGVIVGWDKKTKAPDYWIQVNHFDPAWRLQPNYSVLVDTRDRTDVQTTYVVEENIEIVFDTQIDHPEILDYFVDFDGSQYLKRPWLKELYPND